MTSRSRAVGRASRESPGPSVLLVFDRKNLSLANEYTCSSVFDAHSILAMERELYIVSTGTDTVVRVSLDGVEVLSEEVYWRPDPGGPQSDVHHLNALCSSGGALLVSGLGRKSGRHWSSAEEGFIVDIRTGQRIATGIFHPHSLNKVEGCLAWCESSRMTLHILGSDRVRRLPGYTRGMCAIGSRLFVATSKGRRVSKSTGVLTMTGDSGDPIEGRCSITRLAADTLAVERVFDLEAYGWEVYDLLPVDPLSEWPTISEIAWRDKAVRGLRESFGERDGTISWLHAEVAERDRLITSLHAEVAERDRTITRLHREVADRDDKIARVESGSGG